MGTLGRVVAIDLIKTNGRKQLRTELFFDDVWIKILGSIFIRKVFDPVLDYIVWVSTDDSQFP
jgi:hypothetical protein